MKKNFLTESAGALSQCASNLQANKRIEPKNPFKNFAGMTERLRIPSREALKNVSKVVLDPEQPNAARLEKLKEMQSFYPTLEDYTCMCKTLERVMKSERNNAEIKEVASNTFSILRERMLSSVSNFQYDLSMSIEEKQQKNR